MPELNFDKPVEQLAKLSHSSFKRNKETEMTSERDKKTIELLKKVIWTAGGLLFAAFLSFEAWQSISIMQNTERHASYGARIDEMYLLLQEVRLGQDELEENQAAQLLQLTEMRVSLEGKLEQLEAAGQGDSEGAEQLRQDIEALNSRVEAVQESFAEQPPATTPAPIEEVVPLTIEELNESLGEGTE